MQAPPQSDSRWLFSRITPTSRRLLLLATGGGLVAGWLGILQAGLIAWLVYATLVIGAEPATLATVFGLWLLSIPLRSAGLALRDQLALKASLSIREHLRRDLIHDTLELGPVGVAHFGSARAGSVLLDQLDALEGYFARFLPQCLLALLLPLSIIVVAFWLDWLAALLLLFALPLIPLFMALVGMGAESINQRQFQALERLGSFFLDRLQGLETLRQLGRGGDTREAMRESTDNYRQRTMAVLRVAFLSSAVLEFFSAVAIAMVAIYVGLGLLGYLTLGPAGDLTLFSGLFVLLLAPDVFAPLRELAQHYHDRAAALGAARGLRDLLDQPATVVARPSKGLGAIRQAPEVRVNGLTVTYPGGDAPAIRDLSFRVGAGSSLLLTGPSGAGKTSVLLALLGLLQPREGTILLGAHRIAEYAPGSIESGSAWLGQNPRLLPGSLRDNILLGRPDASTDAVTDAAARAGVLRFADSLPDGLDTVIGERSAGISGGEAQRVALARLLLKQPGLVILDEPTARLDPESRAIMLATLETLAGQCTMIVASHNPEQFAWIDQRLALGGEPAA